MYNDKLVYKVVIWVFFGISLWKEKAALILCGLYNQVLSDVSSDHPFGKMSTQFCRARLRIILSVCCLQPVQGHVNINIWPQKFQSHIMIIPFMDWLS